MKGLEEKLNASGLSGIMGQISNKRRGDWLLGSPPPGYLDDCAAAACVSQRMVFWMREETPPTLRLGRPGRGAGVFFFGCSRRDGL